MCDPFCTGLTLKGQLLRAGNPLGRERFFALMPFHINMCSGQCQTDTPPKSRKPKIVSDPRTSLVPRARLEVYRERVYSVALTDYQPLVRLLEGSFRGLKLFTGRFLETRLSCIVTFVFLSGGLRFAPAV